MHIINSNLFALFTKLTMLTLWILWVFFLLFSFYALCVCAEFFLSLLAQKRNKKALNKCLCWFTTERMQCGLATLKFDNQINNKSHSQKISLGFSLVHRGRRRQTRKEYTQKKQINSLAPAQIHWQWIPYNAYSYDLGISEARRKI